MNESNKSLESLHRNGDLHCLTGRVLDIGAGEWPIRLPRVKPDCWDLKDGDAQYLHSVKDCTYDAIVASHVLEHMQDPMIALANWRRVLKPGGYMVVLVPDFYLYEHGRWPSVHNLDHKIAFTLFDLPTSQNRQVLSLRWMLQIFRGVGLELVDARLTCDGYDFHGFHAPQDQTLGSALAQVTYILRRPFDMSDDPEKMMVMDAQAVDIAKFLGEMS